MDIVHHCLALVPVPYLATAFSVFRYIWASVLQAQASKLQLNALAAEIAQLLHTLDTEYRNGRLQEARTSAALEGLSSLLREVSEFVQQQTTYSFLKCLYTKERRIAFIEGYHRRILTTVAAFQVASLLRIQDWQSKHNEARANDQRLLVRRLGELEANHASLMDALNAQDNNMMAILSSLRKQANERSTGDRERQFYLHSLQYLTVTTGIQVELDSWTITCFDVDFGPIIGTGGFGQVFKGTWNKTPVAIKVFKTDQGIIPNSSVIRYEIDTWARLIHPHILQFLGANVLDDRPFVVMPYLKNGNARDYVRRHPDCDRVVMLRDISRGLVYLHSKNVVHGDLKAVNVLIDDGASAVLCDFGLSRVKSDITTRTARLNTSPLIGSRNWMAPERLMRGTLKKPCDVYSFGMTVYEIYANDVPFSHLSYSEIISHVVHQDIRPERPEDDDSVQLPDLVWELAECCWKKDAVARPTATAICDILSQFVDAGVTSTPTPSSVRSSELPSQSPGSSEPSTESSLSTLSSQTLWSPSYLSESLNELAVTPDNYAVPSAPQTPTSVPPSDATVAPNSVPVFAHSMTLEGHENIVYSVAFSPNGKLIASGSDDKMVRVWDSETGKTASGPFKHHAYPVYCVAFSCCSKKIVSGGGDYAHGEIFVVHADTGDICFGPVTGHTSVVYCVSFSPDGEWIVSGSQDNSVQVWNALTEYNKLGPFKGHTGFVRSVAFSPDGKRIASGSGDKSILVWDVHTGTVVLGPLSGHTSAVMSVAFSPDGKKLASGSEDCTMCIWDAESGKVISGQSHFKGHTSGVTSVAFSPNGQWILSGFYDSMARVFDVGEGHLVTRPLRGHTYCIYSVAFSPDGRRIVTGSQDKTICVYTLQ